jgi:hypothetical protein
VSHALARTEIASLSLDFSSHSTIQRSQSAATGSARATA